MTDFIMENIVCYKNAMPNDPDRCMIYLGRVYAARHSGIANTTNVWHAMARSARAFA